MGGILFTYIKMAKRSVCKTTTSLFKHRKGAYCLPVVYVFLNKKHYLSDVIMKNRNIYILIPLLTLFFATLLFVGNDVAERVQYVHASASDGRCLSVPLPDAPLACPVDGITLPAQPLVHNTGGNIFFKRLPSLQKYLHCALWLNKKGIFYHGALCRQHELSSPFYCTPPCRYYIFALRRLII